VFLSEEVNQGLLHHLHLVLVSQGLEKAELVTKKIFVGVRKCQVEREVRWRGRRKFFSLLHLS